MRLRLGTRGSDLAVTQSNTVAEALRSVGHEVEIVIVRTRGDRERGSLTALAGLGVFAAELRTALLAGECDFAVHSYKDLPVAGVPGLVIAAVPEREDPRDALCARDGLTLAELPAGSRIGTGSPRRIAQLRALRPDCEFIDIRGNVGTRLGRVAPGDLDAVVLATAGLKRLGLADAVTEHLDILPAPGQGALAVECRSDDASTLEALAVLDHPATHAAADAERAVLAELGGGCAAPIGARAGNDDGTLVLRAGVFAADGVSAVTDHLEFDVTDAAGAGRTLARRLLDDGAGAITQLDESRESRLAEFHDDASLWGAEPLDGLTLLVPRVAGPLSEVLQEAGATVWCEPVQRVVALSTRLEALPGADWVAVTSASTVDVLAELGWRIPDGARIAAVGPATARALEAAGYRVDLVPGPHSSAEDLLAAWPEGEGSVLVPGSARSRPVLTVGLRERGWDARALPLYTTEPVEPSGSLSLAWDRGEIDGVLVTSGSVADSIDSSLGWREGMMVVALGRPSGHVLERLGVPAAVAETQDGPGVLAAFKTLLASRRHEGEK
ncbi:hypothetical protein GCM10028820_28370 [Tessaracoccus terricola]